MKFNTGILFVAFLALSLVNVRGDVNLASEREFSYVSLFNSRETMCEVSILLDDDSSSFSFPVPSGGKTVFLFEVDSPVNPPAYTLFGPGYDKVREYSSFGLSLEINSKMLSLPGIDDGDLLTDLWADDFVYFIVFRGDFSNSEVSIRFEDARRGSDAKY